jgi:2'-5' RNA ligase
MRNENLYFIAIIPPDEIRAAIVAMQLDFARHYNSKAALKVIPHITLKTPFKLPVSGHADLQHWFKEIYTHPGSFPIELKDFGIFSNKYKPVIYVNPIMNVPLYALQKEIIRSFRIAYPGLEITDIEIKFKPHITIAYRDLMPDKFSEAWNTYKAKEFRAAFDVSSFHLLQHDGKMWNIIETHDNTDQ